MKVWKVQDAKTHLSEVIEQARTDGPQTITRHGAERAVLLSIEDFGELRRGFEIKRRSDPQAAKRIGGWIDGPEVDFIDRILHVDASVAHLWDELSADQSRPVVDTLIAATALVHGLTLVTRNANDIRGIGLSMVDPWQAHRSEGRQR